MRGLWSFVGLVVGLGVLMVYGTGAADAAGTPRGPDRSGTAPAAAPWSEADEDGVRAAVLDYVEGVYEVAPERIERSVHPSLRKVGYMRRADGSWNSVPMSFDELVALAARWNADDHLAEDAPKEVTVLDVLDQTASAKLVADWGVDYFHLARLEDRWQIVNVMWQTPPDAT